MNGYVNPVVVQLPNPVGLDVHIQVLQKKLANSLPWLQKAFGRAFLQREVRKNSPTDGREETVVYPECRGIQQEPINMMPNDNLTSYCFFFVRDPTVFVDYTILDTQMLASTPISLIFWVNLKKVDSAKNYRFAEELKLSILRVLQDSPDVFLSQVFEGLDTVFEQFTITETYLQYVKPPYAAMRFDFEMRYPVFDENNC